MPLRCPVQGRGIYHLAICHIPRCGRTLRVCPAGARRTAQGYSADTGVVTPHMLDMLRRCDAVVLESNHCPEMLANGPYPESLKRRIRSTVGISQTRLPLLCCGPLEKTCLRSYYSI